MVTDYPGFYIVFGDGLAALCVEMMDWIDPENKQVYKKMKLKPTNDLARVHMIKQKEYDSNDNTITKQYPAKYAVPLNVIPGTGSVSWMFMCDWNSNECSIFTRIDNETMLENQSLKKENETHRKHIAKLQEELMKAHAFPEELEEQNLGRYRRIKAVVGDNVVAEMKSDPSAGNM